MVYSLAKEQTALSVQNLSMTGSQLTVGDRQ